MKRLKFDSKIFQIIKSLRIAVPILGTAIFFFACNQNNLEQVRALSSPEELPILETNNFETMVTDSGTVRFSLKAPKLLRFENNGKAYIEFPQGMLLIEYDADHQILSSIKADYAKQFVKEQRWEAKNNVIVTNEKGDTLKTDHLIWEEKNEKIYTEEFVSIISEDKVINGIGLISDQDMQNWEIKNPTGVFYVDIDNNNPVTEDPKEELTTKQPNGPVISKPPPQKPLRLK